MIFDKEKVRRTAEKNLSNGRLQAAIKDYCQIVERDPRDYNTLNTLGDLYARVESFDDAVKCFSRIAEHYNAQGFAHKAIAMYKKVLRLKPNAIESAAKLAPLYQSLGLIAEARNHYLMVADDLIRRDRRDKALEVWVRIADLDPNDTQTRLKVAQSYLESDKKAEAADAFSEAGSRLLAKRQYDEASKAFNTVLNIKANDVAALSGLTTACIELEMPDEVIGKLEYAAGLQPENIELLSLLAQCYVEMRSSEAAEDATSKLVAREPSSYTRHLEIVAMYLHQKREQDATRVLNYCAEMMLSNGQEDELELWINKILTRDQEQLTALRMMARLRAWQRQEDNLKIALERLGEAARWKNAADEERGALKDLIQLFPEDERYLSRFKELEDVQENSFAYSAQTETVPMFESFNAFHDSHHNQNESISAEDFAKSDFVDNQTEVFSWSEQPEPPQIENDFTQTLKTNDENDDWNDVQTTSNQIESSSGFESNTQSDDVAKDESSFSFESVDLKNSPMTDSSKEIDYDTSDEATNFETADSLVHDFSSYSGDEKVSDFDSNSFDSTEQSFDFEILPSDENSFDKTDERLFGVQTNDDSDIKIHLNESVERFADAEFSFTNAPKETKSTSARNDAPNEVLDASIKAHLQQELESVDFYILQEYHDLAAETLNLLHIQFGDQPEIQLRFEKLQEMRDKKPSIHETVDTEIEQKFDEKMNVAPTLETPQTVVDEPAEPKIENLEVIAETESNAATDFVETEPQEQIDAQQIETNSETVNADDWNWDDEINVNIEKADVAPIEIKVEPETEEIQHLPEIADAPEQLKSSADYDDLFADFNDDSEVANLPLIQTADYETHYNLGLAYKEMSLMDDAVEEFQTAIKMVEPTDGTPRYLQCCNLLGHCFIEKDMPKLAVKWLKMGLDAPNLNEDERFALRYELAIAHEKSGEKEKAVEIFTDIYAVNVAYRQVGEKLRTLTR